MKEFPQIHVINLDRSVHRFERFKQRNAHLGEFVRVSAVDGSTLDRELLVRSGEISSDLPYGAGALGCALSHIGIWRKAASENRSVTVFEDDVVAALGFYPSAKRILDLLPDDWDLILWGYVLGPLYVWIDMGVVKVRMESFGPMRYQDPGGWAEFQAEDFNSVPLRLRHAFGTQGYSISPKGARAALEFCLPLKNQMITFPEAGVTTPDEGIDCALCALYPNTKSYLAAPQLLLAPHDTESDIELLGRSTPTEVV